MQGRPELLLMILLRARYFIYSQWGLFNLYS